MTIDSRDIERQAAEWAAKSDRGLPPQSEQANFEQWRNADPRHYGAYMKALAVQIHLMKMGMANPSLAPKGLEYGGMDWNRRMVLAGLMAASLCLILAASLFWQRAVTEEFVAPFGATRIAALPDGSIMTLNTSSRAAMRYTPSERKIILSEGEALFDVAKNKKRPFDVIARRIAVRAVGTSFTVKNIKQAPLEIIVREGVVSVTSNGTRAQLTANMRATIAADGHIQAEHLTAAAALNALLWRQGYIFFDNSTLADAAQQFSRYSQVRLAFADPTVSGLRVSGLFKASNPAAFAKAASLSFNLKLQSSGETLLLSKNSD